MAIEDLRLPRERVDTIADFDGLVGAVGIEPTGFHIANATPFAIDLPGVRFPSFSIWKPLFFL
jgi:hypothetical protein